MTPPLSSCTAVVLAGGASRRMRRDKAALDIDGGPLVWRVVRRVAATRMNVVVVGPDALAALVPGVRVIPDAVPRAGPLGGLVTALRAVDTRWIALVACDMPFVAPDLLEEMLSRAVTASDGRDGVVLRTRRGLEPLHAVYARRILPVGEQLLEEGERSMMALLAHIKYEPYDAEDRGAGEASATNVNRPEEWQDALRRIRAHSEDSD